MDMNTLPDRISTLIVLLIAILGIISSRIPDIQNAINAIPQQYQFPALIVALIITGIIGAWSFYTSEQRSKTAYDQGLYEPVPPDTASASDTADTGNTQELE